MVTENIKSLGIIITKNVKDINKINFDVKLTKFKSLLNMWKGRKLSIKGRITILRSKALPLILYPVTVLHTPQYIIEEIDKNIMLKKQS